MYRRYYVLIVHIVNIVDRTKKQYKYNKDNKTTTYFPLYVLNKTKQFVRNQF